MKAGIIYRLAAQEEEQDLLDLFALLFCLSFIVLIAKVLIHLMRECES